MTDWLVIYGISTPLSIRPPVNPVQHYENFPVASWLCPAALRPAVVAIYHFARTADDLADEGDMPAPERLSALQAYRTELLRAAGVLQPGPGTAGEWPQVFGPLRQAMRQHQLPTALLADLLDAFVQDVHHTQDARGYPDQHALLDYCRRSAHPVGRLLLHLYGIHDEASLRMSDQICSALQLANFWQDLSRDLPRGRYYLPEDQCRASGAPARRPPTPDEADSASKMIAQQVQWARTLMQEGAPLCRRIPGRAGWELRGVVQGGLRILEHVERLQHRVWQTRPRLGAWDALVVAWRSLWM